MTKAARKETVSSRSGSDESTDVRGREVTGRSGEAAEGIKRFRKVILLVIAFVVGVVLLFSLVSAWKRQRTEELASRFYAVFTRPIEDGEEPDMTAVDAVLEEAQGRQQEEWFLRATVEYLLSHADEKDTEQRRAELNPTAGSEIDMVTPDDGGSALGAEAARQKARTLVEAARDRFDSPTVSEWTASVLARLDGLRSDSWRPPPRAYQVRPPSDAQASGEEPPTVDENGPPAEEATTDTGTATSDADAPGETTEAEDGRAGGE